MTCEIFSMITPGAKMKTPNVQSDRLAEDKGE